MFQSFQFGCLLSHAIMFFSIYSHSVQNALYIAYEQLNATTLEDIKSIARDMASLSFYFNFLKYLT